MENINNALIKNLFDKKIEDIQNIKNNIAITQICESVIIKSKTDPFNIPNNLKEKKIIYIFKLLNNNANQQILDSFKKFKDSKQLATCKINNSKLSTKYLYVGSCKDISSRIKQHLGIKQHEKTYALYLSKWWDYSKFGNLQIDFYEIATNSQEGLQICEDLLWDYFNPLLGKKGSNNKA